jgi:excisionase family DNA binding protein
MIENELDLGLLTRQETCQVLQISLMTLYNLTKAGVLKAYRLGPRHVFYKREEILAALKEYRYKSSND